tara:strand:- start:603 stop:752 length:150 start_codon:yes stop_codon:yes gene_type:complete
MDADHLEEFAAVHERGPAARHENTELLPYIPTVFEPFREMGAFTFRRQG